jgi:hypothetical protein
MKMNREIGRFKYVSLLGVILASSACSSQGAHSNHPEDLKFYSKHSSAVSTLGGSRLTFYGDNFTSRTKVKVGKNWCKIVDQHTWTLSCILPSSDEAGELEIFLIDGNETVSAGMQKYTLTSPEIHSVQPDLIFPDVDTSLTFIVLDAHPQAQITVGGVPCQNFEIRSNPNSEYTKLGTCRIPPNPSFIGLKEMKITNPDGSTWDTWVEYFKPTLHTAFVTPHSVSRHQLRAQSGQGSRPQSQATPLPVSNVHWESSTPGHIHSNLPSPSNQNHGITNDHRTRRSRDSSNRSFGNFNASEAQLLKRYFEIRIGDGDWLSNVRFRNANIEIDDLPQDELRGYIIHDSPIADLLGVIVGAVFPESELQERDYEVFEVVLEASADRNRVEIVRKMINPIFNLRPVSTQYQTHINQLRERLDGRINELNTRAGGFYSEGGYHGAVYLHERVEGRYLHREVFRNILTAIEDNNEDLFYENAVRFAAFFDQAHVQARRGFLDTFSHLFVTKEFPSEGLRQQYLHFTLRCGGLY